MPEQPSCVLVIDTNILWSDKPFREGVPWTTLLSYAAKYNAVDFVVPEVVVHELARQESSRISRSRSEGAKALGKARSELARAGIDFPAAPTVREVRSAVLQSRHRIAEQMTADLAAAGVLVAPIPSVAHDVLVSWSLDAHPPFDDTDKGYRDALIWRTVCEVAADQSDGATILFVGADGDYTEKSERDDAAAGGTVDCVLHSKLVADLEQLTTNTVTVVPSMRAAIETLARSDRPAPSTDDIDAGGEADTAEKAADGSDVAQPTDEQDDDVFDAGDERPSTDDLLREMIEPACDLLVGEDIGSSYEESAPKFEYEIPSVENATVTAVIPDLSALSIDVHERFDGDTVIGDVTVQADIYYEGYVAKSDVLSDNVPWTVADGDWNDHYVLVEGELGAELTFQFVVNNEDVTLEFDDAQFHG